MKSVILLGLLVLVAVNAVPTDQEGTQPVKVQIPFNVIETPIVCKPGFQPDKNGVCREVWSDPVN